MGEHGLLGRVDVLLDPKNDAGVTAKLFARHDPGVGVIVVHPTTGTNSVAALAYDVLQALGRPVDRLAESGLVRPSRRGARSPPGSARTVSSTWWCCAPTCSTRPPASS